MDDDAAALQIQFDLYREQLMEQFDNPHHAPPPDQNLNLPQHQQQLHQQQQQLDYSDFISEDDEAEDELAPFTSGLAYCRGLGSYLIRRAKGLLSQ